MSAESFMSILKRGDKKIEEARAKRIAGAVYDEQFALVAGKRAAVRKLEHHLDKMLDMSPSNSSQTVNRIMDLDANGFVQEFQQVQVDLELARVEYRIADATLRNLFPEFLAEEKEGGE